MSWDQLAIMFCGVTAVFLSQSKSEDWRKFACLFGLAAQPAWFYTTFIHEQWGIFGVSFLYTFSWLRGVYNFWFVPNFPSSTSQQGE